MKKIVFKEKIIKYNKFIKFIIIGISNLCISLLTYYIFIYLSFNYQIANIMGFITGSVNGYLWNKSWVFKNSNNHKSLIVKFYLSYLSTWFLSSVLLYFWIEICSLPEILAPILNVFITTPINYVLNKYWTFKK